MEVTHRNKTACRCKICNLPHNYANISFNEQGICNYCTSAHAQHNYKGLEVLKRDINDILSSFPNRPYDCAVGISGGRDSSYLLYFAKEVLGLKVLAITMTHDFLPQETSDNIQKFVSKLGVDLEVIPNKILNKASRTSMRNWLKKPDAAMCYTFCTGCRYGLLHIIPKHVKQRGIPILLVGNHPSEEADFHTNLFSEKGLPTTMNKLRGYVKRLMKNPSYIFSLKTFYYQIREFFYWREEMNNRSIVKVIKPFFYIEFNEEEVDSKIRELGWTKDRNFTSTWRADCYVNVVRQFFYKKYLGYNDIDYYYAELLRNNKIQLSEALDCIEKKGNHDEDFVRFILKKYYGIEIGL